MLMIHYSIHKVNIRHTNNVLSNVGARDFAWLTEANLVDSCDAALVLCLVDEVLDDIISILQVLGDVAADPVLGAGSFALNQVPQDGAATIVGGGSPAEANRTIGGVSDTGVHHGTRRTWDRADGTRLV